jgi:hypothetical protein
MERGAVAPRSVDRRPVAGPCLYFGWSFTVALVLPPSEVVNV